MTVPESAQHTADQIERLFAAQQQRAVSQSQTTVRERLALLDQIAAYLADPARRQAIVAALRQDLHKHEVEAEITELIQIEMNIRYIRRHLTDWVRPKRKSSPITLLGTRSYVLPEARGCCLIIAPWNYPFQLAITPLLYALAAGNVATVKPSEISVHTSSVIREMMETLFPESLVAVVEGDKEVAQRLLAQPYDHIHFTGSPQVGKIIMRAAANHLSSITLELGGKSPAIFDRSGASSVGAQRLAWGKLVNAGQTCIAPDYLMIEESVQAEFLGHYCNAVEQLYGTDPSQSPDYCRIISDTHYARLRAVYEDALEQGAQEYLGGTWDAEQRYVPPTVLTGITDEMRISQEEIFGPLLPVIPWRESATVLDYIAARPNPLALYLFTRHKSFRKAVLAGTTAGGTVINDFMIHYSNPDLPFGGAGFSGLGRGLGERGFMEFCNERGVTQRFLGDLRMIHPPYTDRVRWLVQWMRRLG